MNVSPRPLAGLFSRRAFVRTILAALAALLTCDPDIAAQAKHSGSRATRVLFVGNSYTYFNNLPEIFTRLAEAGHQGRVETRMVAPGGWRLKDHWDKGVARRALGEERWDYVVLQEQSTLGVNCYMEGRPRVAGDEIFRPYAEKWAAEIRGAGATPVFYLTWARKLTPEDQAALNYAYMHAAKEGRAHVAPAGIAWAEVRQQQPAIELYSADGSHPSPAGSYLAACTLYATLFDTSPVGLPARVSGTPINLATGEADPGNRNGAAWKGHLEIRFHSKDLEDESVDLADVQAGDAEVVFTDPKSPQGFRIRFRGVSTEAGSLRGIAEATAKNQESPVRLVGSWRLRKK